MASCCVEVVGEEEEDLVDFLDFLVLDLEEDLTLEEDLASAESNVMLLDTEVDAKGHFFKGVVAPLETKDSTSSVREDRIIRARDVKRRELDTFV
mmetsp:Transcript_31649/g.66121  ORF Transcript_31649/g.66121 Transcript_31649/m.66121 type:complete len:95 (-) Transcript_31649:39-323(-)